jgi:ectoine hydroxylase-related dioxygenase (phytanoyl-CoA dioxygenase family)
MSNYANKFYKENGYYIATKLLVKHVVDLSKALYEFDTVVLQQLSSLDSNYHYINPSQEPILIHQHLQHLLQLDQETYIASLKLCANLLSTHSILMSKEIISIIQSFGIKLPVLQATPVLHVMADDLKIQGGYHGADVHQDWPSLQGSLDTIIIWVPLMPVDTNNFPVEVLPRSHLGGLYPGEVSDNIFKTSPDVYNKNDFIPAELSLGDVLFISSFTLHRTHIATTNGFRIACSTRYDNASEQSYIERKYPFAQKRVVIRDFLFPNFPSLEQVRKIF